MQLCERQSICTEFVSRHAHVLYHRGGSVHFLGGAFPLPVGETRETALLGTGELVGRRRVSRFTRGTSQLSPIVWILPVQPTAHLRQPSRGASVQMTPTTHVGKSGIGQPHIALTATHSHPPSHPFPLCPAWECLKTPPGPRDSARELPRDGG